MTLTWGNLRDKAFLETFFKVMKMPMDYDLGSKFALINMEMEKQVALCNATYDSILRKYGEPVADEPGQYKISAENRDSYLSEIEKLEATSFRVRVRKVNGKHLADNLPSDKRLTPQELVFLSPILEPLDFEDESTEPPVNQ